ncbi:methionine aminopeptidase, type I [Olsenella uli DSM 7084]|uniref:Methionine aminopeptidase n=1 Tax=Olsenella uli (strain ATCC 49627 / DSM 7084 / CCUG 31166 / CIP 109912 / JCM 12494 / LMG 11480 / NCIMB 702895 / VPI D76D-27C) TaxID=633147 RepID=E1QX33_OLSUV|nr:type I methionyl aminopeptidase [Olsenella uli]ADK68686.1 methionine aminopeptidase, type I [Olsenella uli DSM 7084]EUB31143.1 methionine aminopeptidase, type I [Olsenella uli MSTE5]KRO12161.1 methionine aminopeptidase [Olsenella uli DSM 7084]MBS6417669.1 type I methionyl aminopeptidase [Olsenella uli]
MIHIKTPEEIEQMKQAGGISKSALRLAGSLVRPGVSTREIDAAVEGFIRLHGATPTFKGYGGFPGSVCSSVNEQIVHGIPSPEVFLSDGDIISIDTGATYAGWVGDNAWTFYVGCVPDEVRGLCEVTRDCLRAGIEQAVPGNHLGDIGHAVQELAETNGYGVVREYVGHGVGHVMHEDPNVANYGKRGRGVRLQAGMVIAIEPMITLGSYENHTLSNGWTVVTDDGLQAAHYENTVAVTKDGPVILTSDDEGPWCPLQGGEK